MQICFVPGSLCLKTWSETSCLSPFVRESNGKKPKLSLGKEPAESRGCSNTQAEHTHPSIWRHPSTRGQEPFIRSAREGVPSPPRYRVQYRGVFLRAGRGHSFPFPGSGPSAAAAGLRRCPWCWGGGRAVRSVMAPPVALFAIFSLALKSKNQQNKTPPPKQKQNRKTTKTLSVLASKSFSSRTICCFYCHSLTTLSQPEDSTGFSTLEQPVHFPPATVFTSNVYLITHTRFI